MKIVVDPIYIYNFLQSVEMEMDFYYLVMIFKIVVNNCKLSSMKALDYWMKIMQKIG